MWEGFGFWWANPKVRNHMKDLSVEGSIRLKWILNKLDVRAWTKFMWV
jgi:hypothetical protein